MLLDIIGTMGGAYTPAPFPTVSTLTVTVPNGGTCGTNKVSTYATIRGTWTLANADYGNYTVKAYRNALLVATATSGTTTHADANAPGVFGDGRHAVTVNDTWRVDVVRNLDSVVVNTKTTLFSGSFGDCNGPA